MFFLVMYGHHILDYFCFVKAYLISFRFKLVNYFKYNKHRRIEHMEYIVTIEYTFENLHIYFKIRVVGVIF